MSHKLLTALLAGLVSLGPTVLGTPTPDEDVEGSKIDFFDASVHNSQCSGEYWVVESEALDEEVVGSDPASIALGVIGIVVSALSLIPDDTTSTTQHWVVNCVVGSLRLEGQASGGLARHGEIQAFNAEEAQYQVHGRTCRYLADDAPVSAEGVTYCTMGGSVPLGVDADPLRGQGQRPYDVLICPQLDVRAVNAPYHPVLDERHPMFDVVADNEPDVTCDERPVSTWVEVDGPGAA